MEIDDGEGREKGRVRYLGEDMHDLKRHGMNRVGQGEKGGEGTKEQAKS